MNEKNRKGIFIVLCGLILVISILSGLELNNKLYNPEFCGSCHEMQPYYLTYLYPINGSIINDHELTCIQCHSGRNTYEAKKTIVFESITYGLNLSGSFSRDELKPDCIKCHIPHTPVHNNMNNSACIDCHRAHTRNTNLNITKKPFISLHMENKCQFCHGQDFEIPRCIKCHSGHGDQKLENNQCLVCHSDPHVPKIPGKFKNNTVNLTSNLSLSVCKPCHEAEYTNLTNVQTPHTDMGTCTKCHQWHGEIPKCSKCHIGMMIQRHPKTFTCRTCHASFGGTITKCQDCHGRTHQWSASTAIINPK